MPKMTHRIQTFQVSGSGQFPFDMLRYDQCWPASSEDAARLVPESGKRTVTLNTVAMFGPTKGRWESFLWRVVEYVPS